MAILRLLPPAIAALLIASAACATQVLRLDTRELARSSSDIVIGTVDSTRSYWNAEHTRILTDITVVVSETLKGPGPSRLTLTQVGGEVDGMRLSVAGTAVFMSGEEALLFVWRDAKGRAQVNGLAQGKFEIQRDPQGGERVVTRRIDGLALRDPRTLRAVQPAERAGRVRLDDLKREIRQALEEDGR
ncbi:MAG: hypothetical protein A2W29_13490 [Gemmatimonadetes bacterium RBG_16_66_8]|nr:MAG: hypothetical protein A2W29_13490 [Gemmatimonadetes bacterium RBG_16_66_8]